MARLIALLAVAVLAAVPAQSSPCVLGVTIESVIHPVTVEVLSRAIQQAERNGCSLVLVRLDTPGGFLEATRQATERIISSPIPVAVFVHRVGGRAASAGFLLLQAADLAAMAPGTRAGAAHPVMLAGTPDEILKKKIESDTAAGLRTLTDRRGRNTAMAQKAVLESQSFTEQEALREHLIELVASSDADLLGRLNGREVKRFDGRIVKLELGGVRVIDYIPTLRQDIQTALSDPNLALAFTLLGVLGIYLEFTSPGLILPGVAGAVLLVLGLSSLSVLPLNWTGVVLLVMAVALFILEAKIASHGILGGGGVVAMVLGSLLLVDSPVPEMRIRLSTALLLTLPFALISAFLVTLVVRARLRRPATGGETYAGSEAVTLTALSPEGKVLFRGDIWNARAEREIPANSQVRITSRRGLELMVE